jgi:hypothetical protein
VIAAAVPVPHRESTTEDTCGPWEELALVALVPRNRRHKQNRKLRDRRR